MASVYEQITNRIVEQLQAGTAPWRKPWLTYGGQTTLPRNLISQKKYRGINALLTLMSPYASPFWLTYRQASSIGGHVNAGEHSTPICFWKFGKDEQQDPEDGEITTKSWAMCRLYHIFNVEQCTIPGLDLGTPESPDKTFNPIPECERIVAGFAGEISYGGDRAFYTPSTDRITLPRRETFDGPAEFYNTCFHEMSHKSGHPSRLNREGINVPHFFGDAIYSKEELIAEMGAAFLSGHCGIVDQTLNNSASYLQSWIRVLKSDSRLIITAASAAQRAADLILGTTAGEKSPAPSHSITSEPKDYAISASSIAIASRVRCPVAALPIPGERPLLIKRTILKVATAHMAITSIGITKGEDGRRFLNVVGTDKKNPRIHRSYSFKDQDVYTSRRIIDRWAKSQRKARVRVMPIPVAA